MKKTFVTPAVSMMAVETESHILGASKVSDNPAVPGGPGGATGGNGGDGLARQNGGAAGNGNNAGKTNAAGVPSSADEIILN